MSKALRISLSDTEEFLQNRYGTGISAVNTLGKGVWSYTFYFEQNGRKNVIRWSDVSDNFERDAFAAIFNSDVLPVPLIQEIGEVNDRFFAISPFVEGSFLEALTPTELEATAPSVIKMLRALRAVDMSTSTGFGFWNKDGKGNHDSWREFLLDDKNSSAESLIKGWKGQLQPSPTGTADAYDRLWSKSQSLIDYCPEDRDVVHSDLVNRNILVADGKVTAVLDWGSSFFGDPLYDIAWLIFCDPWAPNFKATQLIPQLLEDFKADPNSNTKNMNERLLCYQLNIAAGSIANNTFRMDWKTLQKVVDYSTKLLL